MNIVPRCFRAAKARYYQLRSATVTFNALLILITDGYVKSCFPTLRDKVQLSIWGLVWEGDLSVVLRRYLKWLVKCVKKFLKDHRNVWN